MKLALRDFSNMKRAGESQLSSVSSLILSLTLRIRYLAANTSWPCRRIIVRNLKKVFI